MSATVVAPKTVLGLLREARELYAANPSHAPLGCMPRAGTFCVVTALVDASESYAEPQLYFDGLATFGRGLDIEGLRLHDRVAGWNATHTTEEVLAAFDRAIAAVEAA